MHEIAGLESSHLAQGWSTLAMSPTWANFAPSNALLATDNSPSCTNALDRSPLMATLSVGRLLLLKLGDFANHSPDSVPQLQPGEGAPGSYRLWPHRLWPNWVFQSIGLLFSKKKQNKKMKKYRRTNHPSRPRGPPNPEKWCPEACCPEGSRQPENPNVHMSGSRPSKTPSKFHEKKPKKGEKERKWWCERKKRATFWAVRRREEGSGVGWSRGVQTNNNHNDPMTTTTPTPPEMEGGAKPRTSVARRERGGKGPRTVGPLSPGLGFGSVGFWVQV